MSQDDLTPAIQSCVALVKEVQRRVDSASSGIVASELKLNIKLAKAALLQATKREVSIPASTTAAMNDSINSSMHSLPRSSNGADAGGGNAGPSTTTTTTPTPLLSASFSPTSSKAQRGDIFRSAPLWSVVLGCFYWNKRKLAEQALTALQLLLRCKAVELDLFTTLFLSPYTAAATAAGGAMPSGLASMPTVADAGAAHVGTALGSGGPAGAAAPAVVPAASGAGGRGKMVLQTKTMCRVGEAVFVVLSDYLGTASEPAVQSRVFGVLHNLIEGKGQAYFVGKSVTRTVHAAFMVALQTSQEAIRSKSQHFIQLCVVRVTKGFVLESSGSSRGAGGFVSNTLLEDYTVDVEFDAPYMPIDVSEMVPTTAGSANGSLINAGLGTALFGRPELFTSLYSGQESLAAATSGELRGRDGNCETAASVPTLSPSSFFRSSLDESTVRDAVGVLTPEARLPQILKDLIVLIKNACKLATRPITGSPTDGNADVRARMIALRMLERVFQELPIANCEVEHRCATWLGLVLTACRYDILRTLVRNFSAVTPFSFFEYATHLLGLLLRKCHYYMARDLHTLLAVFLFPLVSSSYADFRQKHAVLSMVHELFRVPHLVIGMFTNYDCSPTFDAGGAYGGMVELLLDFVTDLTFADIVAYDADEEEDGITSDQQQLLRGECIVALHALTCSLYRWISEDPQAYAREFIDSQRGSGGGSSYNHTRHQNSNSIGNSGGQQRDEWAEVYLDNWANDDGVDVAAAATDPVASARGETASTGSFSDGDGSLGRNVSFVVDPATGCRVPQWGKNRNIHYHWKHVHYLLHNKRIALMAVELINAGRWKEAKNFLEARRYVCSRRASEEEERAMATGDVSAVPAGASSYAEIARFISQYPGVSREAISGIFDRINKDPASKLLLRDYLSLFNYEGVPIDVAMRDTTCKFMSWDRPMFEAQVWETIQACFGEEYAKQNPAVVTAKDADTMAGVLLFLHANLHNDIARSSRFQVDSFVCDANACLDLPMDDSDLRAMFERVAKHKWELDAYGRTPTEAERASTAPSVSFKIMTEWLIQDQAQRASRVAAARRQAEKAGAGGDTESSPKEGEEGEESDGTAAATLRTSSFAASFSAPESMAGSVASPTSRTHRQQMESGGKNDIALLNPVTPSYLDNKDAFKLREERHIAFTQAAGLYAQKLEAVHVCFFADRDSYHPQPYIVPHYAEHVRPMLLLSYPSIMASVYMGFRVLEAAPISRQLADTIQVLYDIAAAFVVNLGDMQDAVRATIQRCLAEERAYKLTPPTRATFAPFLLNSI